MRKLIGSLIVAVLLLVPVAASAECAWVLWATLEWPVRKEPTTATGAYESKADCYEALNAWLADAKVKGAKVTGSLADFDNPSTLIRVVCLPDTIDPRAPKGGGR